MSLDHQMKSDSRQFIPREYFLIHVNISIGQKKGISMIVLEYKVKGKQNQYKVIDQAIRTTQFIRNKAIRYWMDNSRKLKIDKFALNKYSTVLRKEFPFVADLNSMAVQSAADIQPKTGKEIGLDVGIESFYTDSNGYQEPNPKFHQKGGTIN